MSICRSTPTAKNRSLLHSYNRPPGYRHVPRNINRELLDQGSLTHRLGEICSSGDIRVRLLQEIRCETDPRVHRNLGLSKWNLVFKREVFLCCSLQPWVFAVTCIPISAINGPARRLCSLGTTPLGEVLFHNKRARRGPIEIHSRDLNIKNVSYGQCWGRQSIFTFHGAPVMVSEYFLPMLTKYLLQPNYKSISSE